jgi:hypothetical protein
VLTREGWTAEAGILPPSIQGEGTTVKLVRLSVLYVCVQRCSPAVVVGKGGEKIGRIDEWVVIKHWNLCIFKT